MLKREAAHAKAAARNTLRDIGCDAARAADPRYLVNRHPFATVGVVAAVAALLTGFAWRAARPRSPVAAQPPPKPHRNPLYRAGRFLIKNALGLALSGMLEQFMSAEPCPVPDVDQPAATGEPPAAGCEQPEG